MIGSKWSCVNSGFIEYVDSRISQDTQLVTVFWNVCSLFSLQIKEITGKILKGVRAEGVDTGKGIRFLGLYFLEFLLGHLS